MVHCTFVLLNTDVNECLTPVCVHGGQCLNSPGSYTCNGCDPGWTGQNCDTSKCILTFLIIERHSIL